ncbi:hypothetical protein F6X40_30480 [Paraburkholderia sp. UCT31]|uniref:hypothetical protein n=1 Tax=Paraburkholderia sp. UCT31 TaxID=2615209 RepID=UPI001655869C|nr:hypothetical protein [Paraburkholderia sp. UCT31]MBC8740944.1 hypothetical protein [Paraburkholderia sp. UCT31]
MENLLVAYSPEQEVFGASAATADRARQSSERLDEDAEMELALAALEVTDEQSLNAFLRHLIERVSRAVGRRPMQAVGNALVDLLSHTARCVLPVAVRRAGPDGALVPAAMQRAGAVEKAAHVFPGELEGLSQEDKEFEVSRQFVRLASDAVRHVSLAPGASPRDVAAAALARSATHQAPGLLRTARASASLRCGLADMHQRHTAAGPGSGGRWVRHGRTIIVADC